MSSIYGYVNSVSRKLNASHSSGSHETFAVLMNWPNRSRPVSAYFKTTAVDEQRQLILNEVLANRVALLRNLPVAETCPCACRKEFLRARGASAVIAGDDRDLIISGIASLDANPHHLRQRIFPPRLTEELVKWKYCAEVAVFDELLLNVDRTAQNLVRVAPHEFVIIDHDRVFGGTGWTIDSLRSKLERPTNANHLADLIIGAQDQIGVRRMFRIAHEYADDFRIPSTLADSLARESRTDRGVILQLISFINRRAKKLPQILSTYLRHQQLELRQIDD